MIRPWGGVSVLALSASPAYAQAQDTRAIEFLLGAAFLVIAIAFAMSAVFVTRRAISRGRTASRFSGLADSLLKTVPAGLVTWGDEIGFEVSPRLLSWLGLKTAPSGISGLMDTTGRQGFAGADYARLEEAVLHLQGGGGEIPPFEVTGAGRQFRIKGITLSGDDGQKHWALWFENITRDSERLSLERKKVAELIADRDALRTMLDSLDFPVWSRGRDLALNWVNQAYVRAVEGETRERVLEMGVEFASSVISNGGRENAARALETGTTERQKHFVVVGGQRRAIRTVDIPLPDPERHRSSVVGYATDITDLEEFQAEFARHMESHAETLNKLSTAVAIFGADKTLEFYNSAFSRLWDLPEDLLSAGPHHSELLEAMREKRLLPEQADFPAWKQQHLSYYTDLMEPLEEMWHLPDSSTIRVVSQPHPLGGLLILFEDVTDRLALERSFNTLIAVQRATLDNLHEGVAVFGSDGVLKLFNPAFTEIWSLDQEFLLTAPHLNEVLANCAPLFKTSTVLQDFQDEVFHDDEERVVKSGRFSRKDDSEIDFTAVPLPDGAILLTYIDVTDSIRIERALRERNEALETADRLKTEFVAHISYELRTPLNNVIGFAELLDKEYYGPLNAQQHNYTRNILESSEQLLLLINDILDIAVIEAGGLKLEHGNVPVRDLLRDVASLAQEELRNREQILDVDCPDDIGALEGDERRLKQAIYNLLSNAMKFTPFRGRISLGARAREDQILLWVEDNGVGIPEEEQGRIFERFHTGSNAVQGTGVGLGLALVENFIALHGGSVILTSRPGEGTRVTCRLPVRQAVKQDEQAGHPVIASSG
jgi:signal transduction histidine kinase